MKQGKITLSKKKASEFVFCSLKENVSAAADNANEACLLDAARQAKWKNYCRALKEIIHSLPIIYSFKKHIVTIHKARHF